VGAPLTPDELRHRLRVRPGTHVHLGGIDPGDTGGHAKEESEAELAAGVARLRELQELAWADGGRAILVVLQGMDTAGKDGAITHVMSGFNPQGVRVVPFRAPSPEEAAHDFLWRAHRAAPAKGEIAIFNRSYYEDVLIVRVHNLVPRDAWRRRYDAINEFERVLADGGTTIVKFFLHISNEEQRQRLQDRKDSPTKRWKFRSADLVERGYWDEYVKAYEDALSRCSTDVAPWYVIPADHKWYRNLAVAQILAATMAGMDLRYPEPEPGIEGLIVE